MKLNIAYPKTGLQKLIEIDDETKLLPFFERRMGHVVEGDSLGPEFKGYVFRITGGNDKQGFPMLQGVLTSGRVRLLFKKGMKCFRPRRKGHRKRKSVRGCIVGPNLSVLCLSVVKKGVNEIEKLTDSVVPRRLGVKRASKIRKLFNLAKGVDVRQCVPRRMKADGKRYKKPKVQRLITEDKECRRRRTLRLLVKKRAKSRAQRKEFMKILKDWRDKKRQVDNAARAALKMTRMKKMAKKPVV